MIAVLDSAYPPSLPAVQAARAAGVRNWGGYLATRPEVGLLNAWTEADFATVRSTFGAPPIAYCSGWDDPAALRALAAAWGVRLCLDVEGGIRDDGAWVDSFLATSEAGLYGLASVHARHAAPFRVVANYLDSDPQSTWPAAIAPEPAEPHGWQWWNSHTEFGCSVDRGWFDDWFAGDSTPEVAGTTGFFTSGGDDMVALSTPGGRLDLIYVGTDGHVYHRWQNDKINDLSTQVESWGGGVVKVTACYTDGGSTIAVFAAAESGDIWFKEIATTDGHVVNEWAPLGHGATILLPSNQQGPPGPAGPPGPPGPAGSVDTGTLVSREELLAALQALAAQIKPS